MGELKAFFLECMLPICLVMGVLLGGVSLVVNLCQWYSCTHSPLDTTYQGLTCYVREPISGEYIPFDKYRSVDGALRLEGNQ